MKNTKTITKLFLLFSLSFSSSVFAALSVVSYGISPSTVTKGDSYTVSMVLNSNIPSNYDIRVSGSSSGSGAVKLGGGQKNWSSSSTAQNVGSATLYFHLFKDGVFNGYLERKKTITIKDIPKVTSISPSSATVNEAKVFTVYGSNLPSTIKLSLQNANCGSTYDITSSSAKISCTPQSSGSKQMYVAKQSGGDAISGSPFTVSVASAPVVPKVTSISPSSATVNEAKVFTVYGSNLPSTIKLSLQNANCGSTYDITSSSAKISCTPQSSGSKQMYVAKQSGGDAISGSPFTVSVASAPVVPKVTSISPSSATVNEAKVFTVYGSNLPSTIKLSLQNANCGSTYDITSSSAKISCTPQSSGSKQMYVAKQSGGDAISGSPFTVSILELEEKLGVISGVSPDVATKGKEKQFTIVGSNLPNTIKLSIEDCDNEKTNWISKDKVFFTCTPQKSGSKKLYARSKDGGSILTNSGTYKIQVSEEVVTKPTISITKNPLVENNRLKISVNAQGNGANVVKTSLKIYPKGKISENYLKLYDYRSVTNNDYPSNMPGVGQDFDVNIVNLDSGEYEVLLFVADVNGTVAEAKTTFNFAKTKNEDEYIAEFRREFKKYDNLVYEILDSRNINSSISRAESVTLLEKFLSHNGSNFANYDTSEYYQPFADVRAGDFVPSLVRLAYYKGDNDSITPIAKENTLFKPFDKVSRQEVYRYNGGARFGLGLLLIISCINKENLPI
jgi:xanthosine utilization system XapX-like protein